MLWTRSRAETGLIRFFYDGIFLEALERLGKMPLPPYIHEELKDAERYQTVYSRVSGSAAAPTAGLHFTEALMSEIKKRGVIVSTVTLHVGSSAPSGPSRPKILKTTRCTPNTARYRRNG